MAGRRGRSRCAGDPDNDTPPSRRRQGKTTTSRVAFVACTTTCSVSSCPCSSTHELRLSTSRARISTRRGLVFRGSLGVVHASSTERVCGCRLPGLRRHVDPPGPHVDPPRPHVDPPRQRPPRRPAAPKARPRSVWFRPCRFRAPKCVVGPSADSLVADPPSSAAAAPPRHGRRLRGRAFVAFGPPWSPHAPRPWSPSAPRPWSPYRCHAPSRDAAPRASPVSSAVCGRRVSRG